MPDLSSFFRNFSNAFLGRAQYGTMNKSLQDIVEAFEKMEVSFREKERNDAENYGTHLRQSILIANNDSAIAVFSDIARTSVRNGKFISQLPTIEEKVRGLPPDDRAQLFDLLVKFKSEFGWGDEPVKSRKGGAGGPTFPLLCEFLLGALVKSGFPMNSVRAAAVLATLAKNACTIHLRGTRSSYGGIPKLGAIRDIARMVKSGLQLSETDRTNARKIADLINDAPDFRKRTGPEATDPPIIKTIKLLAGDKEQDTFFHRMSAAAPVRVPNIDWQELQPERAAFWDDVISASAILLSEVLSFQRDGRPGKSWIDDTKEFQSKFGTDEKNPLLRHGWWFRDTKGEPGFSPYATSYFNRILNGDETAWFRMVKVEEAREFRKRVATEISRLPFHFGSPAIPGIQTFTFDGKDSEGRLLNQLTNLGDTPPGPSWLKFTRQIISDIGADTVLAGFNQWSASLTTISSATISERDYYDARSQNPLYQDESMVFPNAMPAAGTAAYYQEVNRGALTALVKFPNLLAVSDASQDKPYMFERSLVRATLSSNNEAVVRGIAFASTLLSANSVVSILDSMGSVLLDGHRGRCRSPKGLSAISWALGEIATDKAIEVLGKLRRQTADRLSGKQIDRALASAGKAVKLSPEDMQEMAMADHGIGPGGLRCHKINDLTVELCVFLSTKTRFRTVGPGGRVTRGIAKAFKATPAGADIARELESAANDIKIILPEARRRIESAYRTGRIWRYDGWKRRLTGNGLLCTLAERLIWQFTRADGTSFCAILRDGKLVDYNGTAQTEPSASSQARLWHPLSSDATTVAAWRAYLTKNRICQPFPQAWRPIYVATDTELATDTYSNRFSAHILEQAPVMGILKRRGWVAFNRSMNGNSLEHERVRLTLTHYGVAAEFWVSGVGNRIQRIAAADRGAALYAFIATDRISFYSLDKKTSKTSSETLSIKEVPPMALCETMYDIDSAIGRTSIGNDRLWRDRGPNASHPTSEQTTFAAYRARYASGQSGGLAATRQACLANLLPALKIANQCSLEKGFLLVDGRRHSYKVNLVSGNILIAPNDRYLCIVPKITSFPENEYIPFEGDTILSVILSKAFILAEDDKITDPMILRQL